MGLFSAFKKEDSSKQVKENHTFPWIDLTSLDQLLEIKEKSKIIPVVIFKHSTRCVISRMVLREFESSFAEHHLSVSLYILDLLTYREISNEIVSQFQVFHQSPQLIVIKNGEAIYHASHNEIKADAIKDVL
ncbi:bacillithiol system redox-active protein YtxJ [Flavobacteriaceae bacterium]|nr:bacillithiol system redox-active protein YtxJ [Flavobacteriaceae bacterium]